jgi:hypothetical protein
MFNRKKRIIKKLRKLGKHELKKGQNFEDFLFIDDIDSITGNRDDIRIPNEYNILKLHPGTDPIQFIVIADPEDRRDVEMTKMLYGQFAPQYIGKYRLALAFWARFGDFFSVGPYESDTYQRIRVEVIDKIESFYVMQEIGGPQLGGLIFMLSEKILLPLIDLYLKKYPRELSKLKYVRELHIEDFTNLPTCVVNIQISKHFDSDHSDSPNDHLVKHLLKRSR